MPRLIETEAIYLEGVQDAQPVEHVGIYQVTSSEQLFGPRHIVVLQTKTALLELTGGCWVKDAATLRIANNTGTNLQVRPTAEERARLDAAVVEVFLGDELLGYVRPGRSLRYEPSDLSRLSLRCQKGGARCVVVVYPR